TRMARPSRVQISPPVPATWKEPPPDDVPFGAGTAQPATNAAQTRAPRSRNRCHMGKPSEASIGESDRPPPAPRRPAGPEPTPARGHAGTRGAEDNCPAARPWPRSGPLEPQPGAELIPERRTAPGVHVGVEGPARRVELHLEALVLGDPDQHAAIG